MKFHLLAILTILSTTCAECSIRSPCVSYNIDPNIILTTNSKIINHTGSWLTVSWTGIKNPMSNDRITLYSANVDPNVTSWNKMRFCNHDPLHLSSGNGSLRFFIVRDSFKIVFRLLRQGMDRPIIASESEHVAFSRLIEPTQFHIALTNISGQLKVMWRTDFYSDDMKSQLLFSGKYFNTATTTYSRNDMCGGWATAWGYINPGFFHSVIIDNVFHGRQNYQAIHFYNGVTFRSQVFFVEFFPPGHNEFTSFLFGDLGYGVVDQSITGAGWGSLKSAIDTISSIGKQLGNGNHMVFHNGDITYAVGFSYLWNEFMEMIQPVASVVPYMTSVGNHEDNWKNHGLWGGDDSGGECGVPYYKRFHVEPWYSFDWGFIHWIVFSTEDGFDSLSIQYNWIKRDLQRVNRLKTPWIIVVGHRPMYSSVGHQDRAQDLLRSHLEDLFFEYKIDVALWGHHHFYQRTCRLFRGVCHDDGFVNIVSGAAGYGLSLVPNSKPAWLQFSNNVDHGYVKLVSTPNILRFQYIGNVNLKVLDSFNITKSMISSSNKFSILPSTIFIILIYNIHSIISSIHLDCPRT